MDLIDELRRRENTLTTLEVMHLLRVRHRTLCEWVRVCRFNACRLADWLVQRAMAETSRRRVV
jgi:hypothetical protein